VTERRDKEQDIYGFRSSYNYKLSGGKINPLIGIAGVSCVPTTAKVAQKCALAFNKQAIILPFAMGPNVAGVITTAIISGIYVGLLR
jgi:Na+-transporting methylmalonyl-CoA/oxaloacetate decarboxylase beta subunit